MSGVAIIRALLVGHAPLTTLVPANLIRIGILPQNTIPPAISIHRVDGYEFPTVARLGRSKQITERIQVTALAKDYILADKMIYAASLGKGVHNGLIAGFEVRSVLPQYLNPDIPPSDDGIHEKSRDFMVTFVEAN